MKLALEHLKPLALGAAILGSGGGGSTISQERIITHLLEQGKQVEIIAVDELKESDLVVPIAFMGAPLVAQEKMPTGLEAENILSMLQEAYGTNRRFVLMPAEIGGANAFTPLWVGALYGLPVLDADSIGRAFPKINMSSLNVAKISPAPAFLADSDGKREVLIANNPHDLEIKAREICVKMGSRALVALYIMEPSMARKGVIAGSLTKAIAMGRDVITARSASQVLTEKWDGIHLATGVIQAIDYRVEGGFLKGSMTVKIEGKSSLTLRFINEFLAVEELGNLIAATPDILTLLEESTGRPISTSEAKWGLSVEVMLLPSPPLWKTREGLELVGIEHHAF